MTPRDRVLAALHHEQPDETPYCVFFTQDARERLIRHTGNPKFDETIHNAPLYLNTELPDGWKEIAPGIWQDEFGVQWNRTIDHDIGVVCNTCITPDNLSSYKFPDPGDPARFAQYPQLLRQHPDLFSHANIGFSLFERAWTLIGMENLLMAMVDQPDYVDALLDRIVAHNLALVDGACAHPVDVIHFGDDWGQQNGLIMGPALWRRFIKPRFAAMCARVRQHGKYVSLHSCGCVQSVFPDLIECGLHVFNPFQPEVMNPVEMKKKFGKHLTFHGGISTQKTLPYGTPEQTRQEVRRLIREVGKDGGYIAAPAHCIPGDAKPENILAMIDELNHQGR
jgi:uroporphyrinogen decarboxylase